MEKGNEGKSLLPRPTSEDADQGNSGGFSPRMGTEPEQVRVLQLSESFFVADTLEDDESMIIPPTQDMLIPSTPPPAETSDKEGNVSNGNNDTTISNLEETFMENLRKDTKQTEIKKDEDEEYMEISTQNDMTQDLPDLDETQEILGGRVERSQYSQKPELDDKEAEDDDWQLRFSDTQETQELASTAKMREMKEQEELAHLSTVIEEKEDEPSKTDTSTEKQIDTSKLESKDSHTLSTVTDNVDEKEIESEDEIAPSQSCLDDDTYSAFRDQLTQIAQEEQTAHSTPECSLNGGQTGNLQPKALSVPSPIGTKPETNQSSGTEQAVPELEQTTDILILENKLPSSPSKAEEVDNEEETAPILVLDTEPELLPTTAVKDAKKSEQKSEMVCDTIELISTVDDSVIEDPEKDVTPQLEKPIEPDIEKESQCKEEPEKISSKEKEESTVIDVKDERKVSIPDAPSTEDQETGESIIEIKKDDDTLPEALPDTLPNIMLPPRLSRKQKFEKSKKAPQLGAHYEKSEKSSKSAIGSFKDSKSLEKIFNSSYGIFLDHECIQAMLSLKPSEELKVRKVLDFTVTNNNVYVEQTIEIGSPSYHQRLVSPHSGSSSSTTASSTVSTIKSLHSGEMADISSSSSAKSANSSGMQFDTTVHSSMSSQEHPQKTSTQNSEQLSSNFGNVFSQKKKDDSFEMAKTGTDLPKIALSPIEKQETTKAAPGRKRGGRKNAQSNSKAPPPAKRKRGRGAKSNSDETISSAGEPSNSSKDLEQSVEAVPKKMLRRKKNEKAEPPPKSSVKASPIVEEIVIHESSGDPYADSPYGSILPGVRVMARWKDGYYYPGIVQSQELEGRWSVRFDDNDVKAIPQENLIKVFNLEAGTSVLAMGVDDFYDSGIISGHYKDSSGSGYEVELDSGITKRYPRNAVILSNDQAKLLTSSRPPTTPATMTINLDNIIDGKRKRKSVQSPDPNPALKKSSRRSSQRIAKIDPNIDNTEESGYTDKESTSSKRPAETTETEDESTVKQRSTRKRKAAKTGAEKITQVLTQSSVKQPKLFKDYAFLLSNAERKPTPKSNVSDSEILTEDEEIIAFDKDELVNYILTRGGTILDKFDDVQKCTKKNIYLLANTYLRTMKYIQCIAAGIGCIKHHWVQNCCFKGEVLNLSSYTLPAGRSLITNQIVEWHGKNDVLKGLKISLISAPENPFVHTWAPVLLAAKAEFVQKWSLPSSKSGGCIYVDVLVTNPHCPSDVLQSARRRKIPVVSSEWIIQSLIAGKRLPYDAHPKFKHDFTE